MQPSAARSRRRDGARAESAGGEYFASMTDMMLGLVFIFVIVLMVFALDLRQAEQRVTATVGTLTESNLARRDLLQDLAKFLAGKLPVTIDAEDGTLALGDDILFPSGSADAYPEALPKLALLGEALAQVLPCYAVAPGGQIPGRCNLLHSGRLDAVYIEGHTDTTPIHTARFHSNWDLSAARASETFSRLVEAFPGLANLKNDQAQALIGVSGYGQDRPVDDSGTPAGMQKNRRIELRFIMAAPSPNEAEAVAGEVKADRLR